MADKKGNITLYLPEPKAVELAVFEIVGQNSLDGAKVVRLTIGGVHFGFTPDDADRLAGGLIEYAEHIRNFGAASGGSGDKT